MTKSTSKKSAKARTSKKTEVEKPKLVDKKTLKNARANLELKLSVVFAGIAMFANVLIYFFAILPAYEIIDGESQGSLSETLDSSERVTDILTPVVFVALAAALVLLAVGTFKYVKNKPKAKSSITGS